MAGYINYERSCNSQKCINNYIVPKGMIDKELITQMLNTKASDLQKANVDIKKVQKVPVEMWRKLATYNSWHHTGKGYRKTPHFDLIKTAQQVNKLSEDELNDLIIKASLKRAKKPNKAIAKEYVIKREQANKIAKARLNVAETKKAYDQASAREKKMFKAYKAASYAMLIEECANKLDKVTAKKVAAKEAYDTALAYLAQLEGELNLAKTHTKRKGQQITCVTEVDLVLYEEVKATVKIDQSYDYAMITAKRNLARARRDFKRAVAQTEVAKQNHEQVMMQEHSAINAKRAYDVAINKMDEAQKNFERTQKQLQIVKDERKIAVMNAYYN